MYIDIISFTKFTIHIYTITNIHKSRKKYLPFLVYKFSYYAKPIQEINLNIIHWIILQSPNFYTNFIEKSRKQSQS